MSRRRAVHFAAGYAVVVSLGAVEAGAEEARPRLAFTNVAAPESVFESPGGGRGALVIDYDNDHDLDLLVASSEVPLDGLQISPVVLLRNEGGGVFTDATAASGLEESWRRLTFGITAADVDNDGWLDIYVANGGKQTGLPPDVLYVNQGGTFADETALRGLDAGPTRNFVGVWIDVDNDGRVDLVTIGYATDPIRVFQNRGLNGFVERTAEFGLENVIIPGQGATTGDFDGDGYTDIYVPAVSVGNLLLMNQGGRGFSDEASSWGVRDFPRDGYAASAVDFDHDGWDDLVVAGYGNISTQAFPELSRLFLNVAAPELGPGRRRFQDVTVEAGLFHRLGPGGTPVGGGAMGLQTGDFDLDGWVDVYISNGGPYPEQAEPDLLFRHLGVIDGLPRFENVTETLANPFTEEAISSLHMSHGAVFFDYDQDGDVDIYANSGGPGYWQNLPAVGGQANALWRNDSGDANHAVRVVLEGRGSGWTNRAAIGARVRVIAPSGGSELIQNDQIKGSSGFGQQNSLWLHFGLAEHTDCDIEVTWTTGVVDRFEGLPADRSIRIHETEGIVGHRPLP